MTVADDHESEYYAREGEQECFYDNPKNKREGNMKEYSNSKATATCTSYDQNKKAFKFTTKEGKSFYARKGSKVKDIKFSFGSVFEMELGKETGVGDVWYVNTLKIISGGRTGNKIDENKDGYDSKGQEKGNFRTLMANHLTMLRKDELTGIEDKCKIMMVEIDNFVNLLKYAEEKYFGVEVKNTPVVVDKPVAETLTQDDPKIKADEDTGVVADDENETPAQTDKPVTDIPF